MSSVREPEAFLPPKWTPYLTSVKSRVTVGQLGAHAICAEVVDKYQYVVDCGLMGWFASPGHLSQNGVCLFIRKHGEIHRFQPIGELGKRNK